VCGGKPTHVGQHQQRIGDSSSRGRRNTIKRGKPGSYDKANPGRSGKCSNAILETLTGRRKDNMH